MLTISKQIESLELLIKFHQHDGFRCLCFLWGGGLNVVFLGSQKVPKCCQKQQPRFPGGTSTINEVPEETVWREMIEEIGTNKAELIHKSIQWINYKIPKETLKTLPWGNEYVGQTQKWFAMRFLGDDIEIDPTGVKNPEFSSWKWSRIEEIREMAVPFKRAVYGKVVSEFTRFAKAIE